MECHTVPQHAPRTSSGIHSGIPARRETATRASGRESSRSERWLCPKVRLMHAGKYTAAAPVRLVSKREIGDFLGDLGSIVATIQHDAAYFNVVVQGDVVVIEGRVTASNAESAARA